ncbi:hypothetical protein P7K49_026149, partial [Saguinus oedipus]
SPLRGRPSSLIDEENVLLCFPELSTNSQRYTRYTCNEVRTPQWTKEKDQVHLNNPSGSVR